MSRLGWWARAVPSAAFWFLAWVYLTLPDVRPLATGNPASTAFMRMREAEAVREGRTPRRQWRWVPYSRISAELKRAVLVAEDSAFWQHEGIDLDQIRESMEVNWERREFARGASTITQQLAKNLYLSPSRNPVRKLRELFIARRLEAVLSKRRILELYLNVIEWGDGIWGAEAAARAYFHKPAAALTTREAALLAAAIINPRALDPAAPSPRLRRRQELILRRMGAATPPPDTAPAPPQEDTPATPREPGPPAAPSDHAPAAPSDQQPGSGAGKPAATPAGAPEKPDEPAGATPAPPPPRAPARPGESIGGPALNPGGRSADWPLENGFPTGSPR
jgi:monofunctional biosynthetic peptidoglycan transglycosylase